MKPSSLALPLPLQTSSRGGEEGDEEEEEEERHNDDAGEPLHWRGAAWRRIARAGTTQTAPTAGTAGR